VICPVCNGEIFSTLASSAELEEECRLRERFIKERLARPASKPELKDLTDFFHQAKAEILECTECALLYRRELESPPADAYSEDEYDLTVMEHLYPGYLDAFRAKETPYHALLPPGARVLEVGSHYGAFLQTAQEWGWRAEGVDIGKDTARFARGKGFTVHGGEVAQCGFPDASFEAVFIWNCFEQIENPKPLLAECRRILKPDGVLTVRTPNGLFYSMCKALLRRADLQPGASDFLIEAMGYNNLLGFPYLYGHSRATLERLIEPFGFRCDGLLNSELLILPLPENPAWVDREERLISKEIRMLAKSVLTSAKGVLAGPWIEIWFRLDSERQAGREFRSWAGMRASSSSSNEKSGRGEACFFK
jgi:SAM-dependent methyltransferase